jgi:uncharacterized protein with WD repeat
VIFHWQMEDYYQRYNDTEFPRSKLLLWAKQGVGTFWGPPSIIFPCSDGSDEVKVQPDPSLTLSYNVKKAPVFSYDGSFVLLISEAGNDVTVLNTENGEDVISLSCAHTEYAEFSPQGTFIITWSRASKNREDSSGPNGGNLRVWRTRTGELVASSNQRVQKKGVFQWNSDESICVKLGTNEIHRYVESAVDGSLQRCGKLFHKDIAQFSLCPVPDSPFVAAFVPEKSGKPAKVSLFRCPVVGDISQEPFVDVGVSRALFSATECKMFWNPSNGRSILVQTQR